MSKTLNIIGLILGFIGAFLAFLDSWRTGSRFDENSILVGYGPSLNTVFWNWCGRVGFALITIGFVLQLIAVAIGQ
ncbi:MAG: hypothetical protein KME13_24305 [Myxacorys californica WJT36-NPBG1]|jgi:uncharacterized membrane protein|nr:hypothetical protein [Myxacorys californica WJT36-NPBG1]